ncbi:hypothetical protein JW964_10075 [candidate division KSB1 bacterium]|nr:hypothetical protein [candidate division KSB1 bacterium]
MLSIHKLLLVVFVSLMVIAGCDKTPAGPDYQKEISIYGYLWGDEPLTAEKAILVTYLQPLDNEYSIEKAAVQNALVTITEISSGVVTELKASQKPGFYYNESLVIKPKTTYELRVDVDGLTVTARTTVPPELKQATKLAADSINQVFYENLANEKPVFLECESPDQIILVDMYCNEPLENAEYINPFFGQKKPQDIQEYEGEPNGEPRHIFAPVKFAELISVDYPGKFVVDWYSSMLVFLGANSLQVLAIDDNYHKFITTKDYPQFTSGIKGGVGVFGSVYGKTYKLNVKKR